MPKSIIFPGREEGFETKSVTDTRATTDKNDNFLKWGSNTGKSGWTKIRQNAIWGAGVSLKTPNWRKFAARQRSHFCSSHFCSSEHFGVFLLRPS